MFISRLAVNTPHTYFTQQHYVEITWMWSFCLLNKLLLAQHIFSSFPLCSFVSCSQFSWIVSSLQSIFLWLSSYGKVCWFTFIVKPKMTEKFQSWRYWMLDIQLIICWMENKQHQNVVCSLFMPKTSQSKSWNRKNCPYLNFGCFSHLSQNSWAQAKYPSL